MRGEYRYFLSRVQAHNRRINKHMDAIRRSMQRANLYLAWARDSRLNEDENLARLEAQMEWEQSM